MVSFRGKKWAKISQNSEITALRNQTRTKNIHLLRLRIRLTQTPNLEILSLRTDRSNPGGASEPSARRTNII